MVIEMVSFKNETNKLVSFQYSDEKTGRPIWNHVHPNEIIEVSDEHAYRAKAHGLTEVGKPVKVESKVVLTQPEKPKKLR